MIPLPTQEMFEGLLKPELDGKVAAAEVIVYFTASWCKACKKLDLDALQAQRPGVVWYKCDVDENTYSLGYAGCQKIPSFVFIKGGKFADKISSNSTELVADKIIEVFGASK